MPEAAALPTQHRVIERIGIGCWVLTFDSENEDDEGTWGQVTAVFGGRDTRTDRAVSELRLVTREGAVIGVREWNNTPFRYLTRAQARKAGFEVSAVTG